MAVRFKHRAVILRIFCKILGEFGLSRFYLENFVKSRERYTISIAQCGLLSNDLLSAVSNMKTAVFHLYSRLAGIRLLNVVDMLRASALSLWSPESLDRSGQLGGCVRAMLTILLGEPAPEGHTLRPGRLTKTVSLATMNPQAKVVCSSFQSTTGHTVQHDQQLNCNRGMEHAPQLRVQPARFDKLVQVQPVQRCGRLIVVPRRTPHLLSEVLGNCAPKRRQETGHRDFSYVPVEAEVAKSQVSRQEELDISAPFTPSLCRSERQGQRPLAACSAAPPSRWGFYCPGGRCETFPA